MAARESCCFLWDNPVLSLNYVFLSHQKIPLQLQGENRTNHTFISTNNTPPPYFLIVTFTIFYVNDIFLHDRVNLLSLS